MPAFINIDFKLCNIVCLNFWESLIENRSSTFKTTLFCKTKSAFAKIVLGEPLVMT